MRGCQHRRGGGRLQPSCSVICVRDSRSGPSCDDRSMPELHGHDLLREWQSAMRSLASSAVGRVEVPHQLLAPLERQVELVQEVLGRERELQRELLARAFAPYDAVFDLLEQSAAALHRQAQALNESARAIEQAAAMMEVQAETFERTIAVMRQPGEIVKRATGVERGREEP